MFKDKVVIVTGGAHGIGLSIVNEFKKEGAHVCTIDINENDYFQGDIGKKEVLEAFITQVIENYGHVDYLINNAKPHMKGIHKCSYEEFNEALNVGVTAAFYLSKLCLPYFREGACIINISSSRDRMSQSETECYTASKGAISALTHAMAISLSGKVRVNAISPGWISTSDHSEYSEMDHKQHPAGRVGKVEDISSMVLFLCSDKASFITGENICIDGGMTKQMIYHDDQGWYKNEE